MTADPAGLSGMARPAPMEHVAVLVPAGGSAVAAAAAATAQADGATVVPVHGYDPRGDPAAITTLAAVAPRQVVAVGIGFGPASLLASRLAAVTTGVQLPGGGQLVVPMHRIVAIYGHPGVPALGALGQQGVQASVARAEQVAAPYRALSTVPVIPAFEIIATVATAGPGPDGSYSFQTPVATLTPWVEAAAAAGMYVILDLQPGRASFLAQAMEYQPLLKLPEVGLALDPEWKLQPGQLPLRQTGSVSITEVNSLVSWLAQLTAQYRLPQKLLVLHEFRRDRGRAVPRHGQRRPGDRSGYGWTGRPGRQAADMGCRHCCSAARRAVRLEEFLRQRQADAEPGRDNGERPAAGADLLSVTPAASPPHSPPLMKVVLVGLQPD